MLLASNTTTDGTIPKQCSSCQEEKAVGDRRADYSVPSQHIRNRMREAQRNQDSLLQTSIVFTSKAGQKPAVQTAEIWKSQTVKVFAQCTTGNDKANIIYGTMLFSSQELDLCEVQ